MDGIETWIAIVVSLLVGVVIAILVQLIIVPWQRRKILGQTKKSSKPVEFSLGDSDGKSNNGMQSLWWFVWTIYYKN